MKRYKPTVQLLEEIENIFENHRPAAHRSPLEAVVGLLQAGRHYGWAGIYIAVDDHTRAAQVPAKFELAESRSKILVAMRLSGRQYGILSVESERRTFRPQDRVFLERVAHLGARFLAGRGSYLARQARRGAMAEQAQAAVV